MSPTMKAIVIDNFGPPENLIIKSVPKPCAVVGTALIRIRAFGVNHAEMHMRRGEWAESVPISGIECVGTIEDCPGGEFALGTPVAALMGGLGRTIPGTYAEYTIASTRNVVSLGENPPKLAWSELAAIPESYATAWTCLFRNLELEKGHTLLIRGATSAFGRAAVNLAVNAGAVVTGTGRNTAVFPHLISLGVSDVILEGPGLPERLLHDGKTKKFDRILELVGNSTVVESLNLVKRGGRLCLAGWLGGLDPIPGPQGGTMPGFNPLLQMASGVHFSFFGSFVFGNSEFPLADVPLKDIVDSVADGKFDAKPSRVFAFEEIQEAHRMMEAGQANGKMVVVVGCD